MTTITATMNEIADFNSGVVFETISRMKQEYSEELIWGLRFDQPGLPIGHIFPNSRIWDDGEPTEDELPGTSCVEFDYVDRQDVHAYCGTPYIVCGYHAGYGQDPGEVILSECEIMAFVEG